MDPAIIAALAGSALAATIEFAYTRISAALDRKPIVLDGSETEIFDDRSGPIALDESALTSDRIARMRRAAGVLEVYRNNPEIARVGDSRLTDILVEVYEDLSELYGVNLLVPSGPNGEVAVSQNLGDVDRPVAGIKAASISEKATVRVTQTAQRVHRNGTLVGIEIEGTIG